VREPFTLTDGREDLAFIIGPTDSPSLLVKLADFVGECDRLRELARNGQISKHAPGQRGTIVSGEDSFAAENEGTSPPITVERGEIVWRHGKVLNALASTLKNLGHVVSNTRSDDDARPDLYIEENGRMTTLFEVKAFSDSQSLFTALGQLVVYGAGQQPGPRRVLVCPERPEGERFRNALKELKVAVATHQIGPDGYVEFKGLEEALKKAS